MNLTLENLQDAVAIRPPDLEVPSRNLYITIWNTLGTKPKAKMFAHLDAINKDGPIFHWTLFTQYHVTEARIICHMRTNVDLFKDRLRLVGGCIDKFYEHVRKTIESIKTVEVSDDQAFDKFMNV